MRSFAVGIVPFVIAAAVSVSAEQQAAPAAQGAAAGSDVYHVTFLKATPGQAEALSKDLLTPDPKAPMPGHSVVLRHQEGDDWDFCVIQHVGTKATVEPGSAPPVAGPSLVGWHNDTFVSGPSWTDFTRAVDAGASGNAGSPVYIVSVHRAAPGHRDQLEKALQQAGGSSKVQSGEVLLRHVEGGDWQYLSLTRYNSWQDLATDRSQAPTAGAGGWADIRQHSAFHRDTVADRLPQK